ncbi:uncharacterized protein LOC121310192 isoform X2 [Polyodon spathula]|uniref:uncharacterized protein LOC121310192 isoform X2 n=1 Tax=Polyodon spathula TaxID=7913 RepID=UPI001B7E5288|nr:uncharacterized protein LOC121310192 isoform X2 [Polyodon spathula]
MSGPRDRPLLPLSSDPGTARHLNALWKYLERTGLQRCVEELCVETLRGPQSPRNPYPAFISKAREQAERYRLAESTTAEKFLSDVSFQTSPTSVRYIAGALGCSHVWGHPSILRAVDPEQIKQFDWLVEDVTPPLSSLNHSSPYTIQVIPALSGPCVFTRTLYPTQSPLELLQIYFIAGPDPRRAAELYADCVRSDVIRTGQRVRHRLLRVIAPTDTAGGSEVFSKEEVTARGGAFVSSVRRALETRLPVRAQCVWRLDPPGTRFQEGAKLYSLSVIQTAERFGEERVVDFSPCPLIHLSSSVFLRRAHAEAYVGIFLPRESDTRQGPPAQGGGVGVKGSPLSSDWDVVLAPIREALLRKIASLSPSQEPFKTAHLCALLLLLEPGEPRTGERPLLQIYRFLQGSAARLGSLRSLTHTVSTVLQAGRREGVDREMCCSLLERVRALMLDFLGDEESSSRDSLVLSDIMKRSLESVCDRLTQSPDSGEPRDLRRWCSYSSVLEARLVSDSLPWVPVIRDIKQLAIQTAGSPKQGHEQEEKETERRNQELCAQDLLYNEECCINLSERGTGPAQHAALTQYLVDCKVDQHWHSCLQEIFSSCPLPSNPYPTVVNEFRRAALRMELWGESDSEILQRTLPGTPALSQQDPLFDCGLRSALRAAHPTLLHSALRRTAPLSSSTPRAGAFKVRMALATQTPSSWLGTLSPFLCSLQVTEFCYITAPPGCLSEVLQAYASIVHSQLGELGKREDLTPFSVHLGRGEVWGQEQVQRFPCAFTERVIQDLRAGCALRIEVFQNPSQLEWRFVPLVKHLVLYYIQEGQGGWLCFPRHDPISIYQAVFQTRDQAAFHRQTVGPAGDPFSCANLQEVMSALEPQIGDSFQKGDLLQTYRLIALRSLITGEERCLPACWRMMHSVSAQLEYLNTVNQALQDILQLNGEAEETASGPESRERRQAGMQDQASIGAVLSGYQDLVKRTLQHPSSLSPPGLWERVLQRCPAGSAWLQHVSAACQCLSDSVAWELHSLCPEIAALLASLGKDRVRERLHSAAPPPPGEEVSPRHAELSGDTRTHPTAQQALDNW